MSQHRRPSSSGVNDSAVYSHLNSYKHSFEDKDVLVLDKERKWFERGVKEAIYVRREEPTLNRGGGLRHNLSRAYDGAISKIPKKLSRDVTSTSSRPIHQQITRPDDAVRMSCDTLHLKCKLKIPVDQIIDFISCQYYNAQNFRIFISHQYLPPHLIRKKSMTCRGAHLEC